MKLFFAIAIVALGAAGLYVSQPAGNTVRRCATEEFAQVPAPAGGAIARYENMVCEAAPEVLESNVWAKREGSQSWHLVFRAKSPIDAALDRKTKVSKLSIRWIDAATLSVEPAANLKIDTSLTNEHFKVLVSGQAGASPMFANQADSHASRCTPETIITRLESPELIAHRDALVSCLYDRITAEGTWQIVNAIWRDDRAAFPKLNWQEVQQPEMRLPLAGVWSVLKRRQSSDANPLEARDYILAILAKNEPSLRHKAICALGNAGVSADVDLLAKIAHTEADINIAKCALSGIATIEHRSKLNYSRLDAFARDETKPELRQHAVQLQKIDAAR
jgi:hypothetical protein